MRRIIQASLVCLMLTPIQYQMPQPKGRGKVLLGTVRQVINFTLDTVTVPAQHTANKSALVAVV